MKNEQCSRNLYNKKITIKFIVIEREMENGKRREKMFAANSQVKVELWIKLAGYKNGVGG
jgi:hypothetical protein